MERTQIYLTTDEAELLDRLALERKTTRSRLIRDAIDTRYGGPVERRNMRYVGPPDGHEAEPEPLVDPENDPFLKALQAFAGIWKDRDDIPDGYTYVNRIRKRPGMRYWEPLGTEEDPL